MAYRDLLLNLAGTTEERSAEIWALFKAGDITAPECEALIATIVGKANIRASSLAASSLAATLTLDLGEPVPVNITPAKQDGHLKTAVATIIAGNLDPEMRIRRLGNAEPIHAAARTYSESIAASKHVEGWTRDLEPDACQLCSWWSRGGQVWPKDHRMPTHVGCTCTPRPVTQ